eukprot:9479710-Pyramimonas_sp.AAC.2
MAASMPGVVDEKCWMFSEVYVSHMRPIVSGQLAREREVGAQSVDNALGMANEVLIPASTCVSIQPQPLCPDPEVSFAFGFGAFL